MSFITSIEPSAKVLVNILVTFTQAAVVAWYAAGGTADKLAIGAAIGAGLSAVWNLIIKPFIVSQGYLKS